MGGADHSKLTRVVAAVLAVSIAVFVAGTLIAASMMITRPIWQGRDYLAISYGIGGLGLASLLTFIAYWLHPRLGMVISFALILGCLVYLGAVRVWRYWSGAFPLALLTIGVLFGYLSILYFRTSVVTDFFLVTQTLSDLWKAPDHLIPFLFSDRLAAGASTSLVIGDWNGSDRPPLLAGFLLLNRGFAEIAGGPTVSAFGAGVVAQALWIPALYAFLRSIGVAKTQALFGILLAGATGASLVNSLYTWPKMLSAALVLCSGAVLFGAIRRPKTFGLNFSLAVVLFALAMLAHGAAGFTLPFVVAIGLFVYRRQAWGSIVRWTGVAAGLGLLTYAPWIVYQRFVDPPGDRLLKWHLAGVIPPEDPRSFLEAFFDSYGKLSPTEWLSGRLANLGTALNPNPFSGIDCLCSDAIHARRDIEFYTTTGAVGIAFPLIGIIAVLIAVRALRFRTIRIEDRQFLFLVGISLLCILFWCIAMFIPGSTVVHQGSQLWVLLLAASPAVWLATRHKALAVVMVSAQFAVTLILYLPMVGDVRLAALGVGGLAFALCATGIALFVRPSFSMARGTLEAASP